MRLSNTFYQTHSKAIIDFLNGSYVKLGMWAHSSIRLNDSHAFTFVYIQNKILPIGLALLKDFNLFAVFLYFKEDETKSKTGC